MPTAAKLRIYLFSIKEVFHLKKDLEGCVCYIFASLFLSLKENTCETKSKALFVLEKIKF